MVSFLCILVSLRKMYSTTTCSQLLTKGLCLIPERQFWFQKFGMHWTSVSGDICNNLKSPQSWLRKASWER